MVCSVGVVYTVDSNGGAQIEYDESGVTFYYFLVLLYGLFLLVVTSYGRAEGKMCDDGYVCVAGNQLYHVFQAVWTPVSSVSASRAVENEPRLRLRNLRERYFST